MSNLIKKIFLCLLLIFSPTFLFAAPEITLISPSTDLWTASNNVEFDVNFTDPSPAYGFIDWQDSLVGWWRGEGNANDESGNNNHGTFGGSSKVSSGGKFGSAFEFDGNGDTISLGDREEFDFTNTDSFTISLWVYKTDNSQAGIIVKGDNDRRYMLSYTSSRWQFDLKSDSYSLYTYSSDVTPQNKWVHIVVVYNSLESKISIYVNGDYKNSAIGPMEDFSVQSSLRIAGFRYWGDVEWDGLIDEVMIFNRSLTPEEIKSLYNATAQNLTTTFSNLNELYTYNYRIYAVNSNGNKENTETKSITVDVPNSPPIVRLDAPLSPTRSSSTTQQFTISAADTNADTTLASAALYVDYGAGLIQEETIALTGDSDTAVFTKTGLAEGTIAWNCYVTDSNGNGAFAANNHTLIIGQNEYYVSTSGDDNNPGTINEPFRTIQKCADIAIAGDTCNIREGTYRETITPFSSGNQHANITFKAYNNEGVVVSGAEVVSGWVQHDNSIYKTTMNWDLGTGKNQIFVNKKALIEARWPNAEDIMIPSFLDIDGGTLESMRVIINSSNLTQPEGYWVNATVHAIWNPRYHAITGTVTSYIPGSMDIDLHCASRGSLSYGIFYITGSYKALDKEGEWFYDSEAQELFLWAPGNISPDNYVVEAKAREFAFNLKNKSYVNIEGIDIFSSTIITDIDSSYIILDDINASYPSHYTLIDKDNMGSGGKGVRDTGIILDGHDNIIKNSEIAYSAGNGVALIGNNNTVHNCTIHDVNYVVTAAAAVQTGERKTENNVVSYCELYNTGREIIVHDWAENMKIVHNEMHHNRRGTEPWDMGATYAIATDGKGTEIAYNHIHDIRSIGIYLDGGPNDNFYIHHNIVWGISYTRNKNAIHMNNPSRYNEIYHNTFDGRISMGMASTMEGTIIKNNLCHGLSGTFPNATLENNIEFESLDPEGIFVNYTAKDFRLRENSPAIDAGQDLGFTEDYDGNSIPQGAAPDIGAYEYVPETGTTLYGDVSGDAEITAYDAALTAQASVDLITLTAEQTQAADVSGDSEVSAYDAALIAQYAVGLISKFPVE